MKAPPWLVIARAEMGVCVHPSGSSHPWIGEYHEHAGISGYDDKVSWCSSFINWSLAQVGITGTGSALARSWLEWVGRWRSPFWDVSLFCGGRIQRVGKATSASTFAMMLRKCTCSEAINSSKFANISIRGQRFSLTAGRSACRSHDVRGGALARNGQVRSASSQPVNGPDELVLRLRRRSSRLRAVHPGRSAVCRTGCRSARLKGKIDLRNRAAQPGPGTPPGRRSDE